MMLNRFRSRTTDEAGFTLVELIAYCVIMIMILGIGGSIFVQLIKSQSEIKAMANANNEAQLVYSQLEEDLRNAAWATIDEGGNFIVMRAKIATTVSSSTTYCIAYHYDPVSGEIRRYQSTSSTQTKAALLAVGTAVATTTSTWPVVVHDAGKIGSARVFGSADGTFDSPDSIKISLRSNTTDDHKPVDFVKTVSMRPQASLGTGCSS